VVDRSADPIRQKIVVELQARGVEVQLAEPQGDGFRYEFISESLRSPIMAQQAAPLFVGGFPENGFSATGCRLMGSDGQA
jgi:hypothetical protein